MFKYLEIQTRTLTNIHAFQHAEITEISAQLDHLNMPNELALRVTHPHCLAIL